MDQHDIEAYLRERIERSAFHRWMGMRLMSAGAGHVQIALDAADHHLNLQGLLHGGVLATLADTAAGLAVRTMLPGDRRHVTISLDVRYLSPGRRGTIIATGQATRVGAQVAFADADVTDANGRLLAKAGATVAVMPERAG